jgi:hypothetical protein
MMVVPFMAARVTVYSTVDKGHLWLALGSHSTEKQLQVLMCCSICVVKCSYGEL